MKTLLVSKYSRPLVAGYGLWVVLAYTVSAADMGNVDNAVFKRVDPSVVAIQHERAGGSGFIISPEGHILTNGHVVSARDREEPKRTAKSITVILHDESKYQAKVIGFCLDPDVALIKIEPDKPLQPVEFGDSRAAHIGQKCFAVGMPLGLKRTFTGGILSNVSRTDLGTFTTVLQTDAAINPGNSGGPLFDISGKVLGLNTYGAGGNNLGFTIPIHVALVLKDHYLKWGRFKRASIPLIRFGEVYEELAKTLGVKPGILVHYVMPGTTAAKAGFQAGDVITAMNGKPVSARIKSDLLDFNWEVVTRKIGTKMTFKVIRRRGKTSREITVTVFLEEDDPSPRYGHQWGEIKEERYDALGLSYRRLVRLDRVLRNLPDDQGVLVSGTSGSQTASKAGLWRGDIVTSVEGVKTPDVKTFEAQIEKSLLVRKKLILITLQRRKTVLKTALKPFYNLQGKKIVLIVPEKDFEHFDLVRRNFIGYGAELTFATSAGKPVVKDKEIKVKSAASLGAIKAKDFDLVMFLGGDGAKALWQDEQALGLVRDAIKEKKLLAAAGAASMILINADPAMLKKKITTAKEYSSLALEKKANYTGKDVQKDKGVITTTGFDKKVMRQFLQAVRLLVRK